MRHCSCAYKQKRRHFHAKMTSAKLYIYIGVGQGTCLLTKHTRRWAYSRYFFPACCLLRFAAFFSVCMQTSRTTVKTEFQKMHQSKSYGMNKISSDIGELGLLSNSSLTCRLNSILGGQSRTWLPPSHNNKNKLSWECHTWRCKLTDN